MEYLDQPICHIFDIIAQPMKKFFNSTCGGGHLFPLSPKRHWPMQLVASQPAARRDAAFIRIKNPPCWDRADGCSGRSGRYFLQAR
jgi:hypothetical protein